LKTNSRLCSNGKKTKARKNYGMKEKKALSALPKKKFPRKKEKKSGSEKRPHWQWRKGENRKPEESITKLMKQTTDAKMPMSKG